MDGRFSAWGALAAVCHASRKQREDEMSVQRLVVYCCAIALRLPTRARQEREVVMRATCAAAVCEDRRPYNNTTKHFDTQFIYCCLVVVVVVCRTPRPQLVRFFD